MAPSLVGVIAADFCRPRTRLAAIFFPAFPAHSVVMDWP
jgi:hypothetical protein